MLSCKQASELVSQSFDRHLSWRERWAVRLHLFICRACTRFREQLQFLERAARAYGRRRANDAVQLSTDARERIQRELSRIR